MNYTHLTIEERSGMFFAARTFAMKMGQAKSTLVYTSVTVSKLAEDGSTYVEASQYRTTAIIATVACLVGAVLFLFYNEKKLLGGIDALKAGRGSTAKPEGQQE